MLPRLGLFICAAIRDGSGLSRSFGTGHQPTSCAVQADRRTRAQQIPKVEFQWQGKLDRKRSRSIAVQEPEMRTFANLPVEMLTEVINFACSYVVTAAVIPFVCHLWKEAAKPWAYSEY